jgi:hypothetical protein
MTDFMREIDDHYPKHHEIEEILAQARVMRARAMRDGAASIWSMLQRAVSRKPAPASACQA